MESQYDHQQQMGQVLERLKTSFVHILASDACVRLITSLCTLISFALQFKEFLGTYNKVTEGCFTDCVNDFKSRVLTKEEV